VYMNLRVTHVKDWLGSLLIINNGQINKLINWSRNNATAVVDFGVAYETDLEKFNTIIPKFVDELASRYEIITEPASFLGVTELADSSINMRIIAKTKPGDQFGLERKIRHDLVVYLAKHGIEIPFPQVVVSQKETSE
ncbi:MAG: mechanosensitive ion channel family protein, partial [Bacillota bacterium]